jgi:hypothetical protein
MNPISLYEMINFSNQITTRISGCIGNRRVGFGVGVGFGGEIGKGKREGGESEGRFSGTGGIEGEEFKCIKAYFNSLHLFTVI